MTDPLFLSDNLPDPLPTVGAHVMLAGMRAGTPQSCGGSGRAK
jgi:hypothetical protein